MYSDVVKKGLEKTPHRSLFKASGFTEEEINRPLIGVVSAKNEIIPGHIHLDKIAEAVKTGVRVAGGTPIEFPAIIDRIAHDSYRINITSIDAEHDISMREVYGLDKALRE